MRRLTRSSLKTINSNLSKEMLSQVFANYTIKDLIDLKQNNIELYKYLCNQVNNYLNPEKLWNFTLELIKMNQENRLQEEILIIMKITENLSFFQRLNERPKNIENQLHQKICSKIFGEFHTQGSIIFRQNDAPSKFYIIMKGAVNIFIHKSQQEIENELLEKAQSTKFIKKYLQNLQDQDQFNSIDDRTNNEFSNTIEETQKIILEQLGDIPPKSLRNIHFFYEEGVIKHRYILTLHQGDMFGELGILMDKPRSASVIAQQDTELAVLESEYYRQILKDVELKKIDSRIEFFTKNFFHNMPYQTALKYCYNFEKKKLKWGDCIYQEGSQTQFVYIVKQGEIKFTKKINTTSLLYEGESDENYAQNLFVSNNNKIQIELYSIGEGQVFGEIEIIEGTNRYCSAQCISASVKIFQLSSDIFQRILKDSYSIRQTIKNNINQKKQWMHVRQNFLREQKEKLILNQYQKNNNKYSDDKNGVVSQLLQQPNLNSSAWISFLKIKTKIGKQIREKCIDQYEDCFNPLNINSPQTERKIRLKLNQLQLSTSKFDSMLYNFAQANKKKSTHSMTKVIQQDESFKDKQNPQQSSSQYIKRINSYISQNSINTFQKLKQKSYSLDFRRNEVSNVNFSQKTVDETNLDYSQRKSLTILNIIKVPFFKNNQTNKKINSEISQFSTEKSPRKSLSKVLINSRHNQFRLKPEKNHLISSRYKKSPSI